MTWTAGPTLSGRTQGGGETGAALGDTVALFTNQSTDPVTTVLWVGQVQP